MATQSHRSNGPARPYDGGTARIQSTSWTASVPPIATTLGRGAKATMTVSHSSRAKLGRKAILLLPVLFALWVGASSEARALDCAADAGGIIDGFVNYPCPPPH